MVTVISSEGVRMSKVFEGHTLADGRMKYPHALLGHGLITRGEKELDHTTEELRADGWTEVLESEPARSVSPGPGTVVQGVRAKRTADAADITDGGR